MSSLKHQLRRALTEPRRIEEGSWEASLVLGPDFIGFDGHFPDQPVTPAVAQMLAGICLAEAALGRPWRLGQVTRAKFLKPLEPGRIITLRCHISLDSRPVCSCECLSDEKRASAFTMILEPEETA